MNANPVVFSTEVPTRPRANAEDPTTLVTATTLYDIEKGGIDDNDGIVDEYDAMDVFDLIRHINDPEHPLTLEQLRVAQLELIDVNNKKNICDVRFTPTIPHCSMATLIGLSIRVKLLRSLPKRFKVRVSITPGTHAQEHQINKQLDDKERVAAALENNKLLGVVSTCIKDSDPI